MFGRSWQELQKRITGAVMCVVLFLVLVGCSQESVGSKTNDASKLISSVSDRDTKIEEVSPPEVIQQLRLKLDRYNPKVKILGPKQNTVVNDTTVTVRFDVDDFPLFKDPELALGPHLHVFLDGEPYQAVYDANQSLTFKDLKPGTHTIRAFASRPWHESVKTEDSFDQLTFHVFAPTEANRPNPDQPLLTYSRPEGTYGGEPILLDYYLIRPKAKRSTPAKVRVSLNGKSFTTDEWTPIYLKGFKSGSNWVKLELLDENDQLSRNTYSEVLRLIQFNPNGQDTLAKLVRGELTAQEAERIVDLQVSQRLASQKREAMTITEQTIPTPKVIEPQSLPSPVIAPTPVTPVVPNLKVSPSPDAIAPKNPSVAQPMKTSAPGSMPKTIARPSIVTPSPSSSLTWPETVQNPVKPKLKADESSAIEPKVSTEAEKPFWSKLSPKQFLGQKSGKKPSQPTDESQKAPMSQQPTAKSVVPRIPTASPTPTSPSTKVTSPAKSEALQTTEIDVKPKASPLPNPSPSITSSQNEKKTPRWQEFLKLPSSSNTEKLPIVKPKAKPTLPDRYLKDLEPSSSLPEKISEALSSPE